MCRAHRNSYAQAMSNFWGLLLVGLFGVLFGLMLVLSRHKVAGMMSGLQESRETRGARTTPGTVMFGGIGFMAIGAIGIAGAFFSPKPFRRNLTD